MPICGKKLAVVCSVLSAWRVIMLLLLGILLRTNSVAFAEDLEIEDVHPRTDYLRASRTDAEEECQLKGFNLQPLTSSLWAVPVESGLCLNNARSCSVIFALCRTSELCPENAFACLMQNGIGLKLGVEVLIIEKFHGEGFSLYYATWGGAINETIIEFVCDAEKKFPHEDFTSQAVGLFKPEQITRLGTVMRIVISHEIGCKQRESLGPGSRFMIIWLLISILILFLLYFLGGIAYNHVNGARGEELIPHHWFWKNFVSYVVDGCFFVRRVVTCQTGQNYSQNL